MKLHLLATLVVMVALFRVGESINGGAGCKVRGRACYPCGPFSGGGWYLGLPRLNKTERGGLSNLCHSAPAVFGTWACRA